MLRGILAEGGGWGAERRDVGDGRGHLMGQMEDLRGEAEKEFLDSTLTFTSSTTARWCWGSLWPLTSDQCHSHQHPVFCSCPFFRRVSHLFLDLFPLLFAPNSLNLNSNGPSSSSLVLVSLQRAGHLASLTHFYKRLTSSCCLLCHPTHMWMSLSF